MELVDLLVKDLDVEKQQAQGGAGLVDLLQCALGTDAT
jgi:hypothetical protein